VQTPEVLCRFPTRIFSRASACIPTEPVPDIRLSILGKDIAYGYCWELRNIPSDDILMADDKAEVWDEVERMCDTCEHFRHQTRAGAEHPVYKKAEQSISNETDVSSFLV